MNIRDIIRDFFHKNKTSLPKDIEIDTEVRRLMEEKINEVFAEMQNALGITSGDIAPDAAIRLDKMTEDISLLIADVLMMEKGGNL